MPYAQLPAVRLYFEQSVEAGAGAPLLFISGTGSDLRNKPNQFDSPLAKARHLICYDQRGLGQSENPEVEFSMAQYADDAAGLLDHLEIDRIDVVGVSFGGMVAQELLLRHPDRVNAAVLACTSSGGEGGSSFPLHELADLDPLERVQTHLRAADLRHTDDWIRENPEKWQQRVDMALGNVRDDRDEEGAKKQLLARAKHDCYARLASIEQPVLLVGGRYDGVATVSNMENMAAQIAESTIQFFEGGHMFLIQDKSAYPFIIQWLSDNQ